ncbi:hypothetical protein JCM19238_5416 [Vibrio ponticus]|nr:hypothetical protein JCM19238_5416 [Vibrio ponticus]
MQTAALGIFIAASVNTIVKMGMVVSIGNKALWSKVAPVMIGCVISGGAVLVVMA